MVTHYKCPHCQGNLHPLRLPTFKGGGRTYRGWSGIWYCMKGCHALVLVADERQSAAPIYVYGSTDWFDK